MGDGFVYQTVEEIVCHGLGKQIIGAVFVKC